MSVCFIYNDIFAKSFNIFGSHFHVPQNFTFTEPVKLLDSYMLDPKVSLKLRKTNIFDSHSLSREFNKFGKQSEQETVEWNSTGVSSSTHFPPVPVRLPDQHDLHQVVPVRGKLWSEGVRRHAVE